MLNNWMKQRSTLGCLRKYFSYLIAEKLDAELKLSETEFLKDFVQEDCYSYDLGSREGWLVCYTRLINGNYRLALKRRGLWAKACWNLVRYELEQVQEIEGDLDRQLTEYYLSIPVDSEALKNAEKQSCIWIAEQCIQLCDHLVRQRVLLEQTQEAIDDYNLAQYLGDQVKERVSEGHLSGSFPVDIDCGSLSVDRLFSLVSMVEKVANSKDEGAAEQYGEDDRFVEHQKVNYPVNYHCTATNGDWSSVCNAREEHGLCPWVSGFDCERGVPPCEREEFAAMMRQNTLDAELDEQNSRV